jgi:bloom syndrome protein
MLEQRAKFSVRGLSTEFVGELQQDIEAMSRVRQGMVQLLYISPESILSNPQWRDMLLLPVYQKNVVAALVVDEAHCITMW